VHDKFYWIYWLQHWLSNTELWKILLNTSTSAAILKKFLSSHKESSHKNYISTRWCTSPLQYGIAARKLLDDKMRGLWIGRKGPTEWPPRSPDLSVCDFHFCELSSETKCSKHRPNYTQKLSRRIEEEIQNFPPWMFSNAYKSFWRGELTHVPDLTGYNFNRNLILNV